MSKTNENGIGCATIVIIIAAFLGFNKYSVAADKKAKDEYARGLNDGISAVCVAVRREKSDHIPDICE